MSRIKDGGPAFPRPFGWIGKEHRGHSDFNNPQQGMSLRDYFAAHAPDVPQWFPFQWTRSRQTEGEWKDQETTEDERFIAWRWFYADAMIAQRNPAPNQSAPTEPAREPANGLTEI